MFHLFKKLFKTMKKPERIAFLARLEPESLESRDLPSVNPAFLPPPPFMGPQALFSSTGAPMMSVEYSGKFHTSGSTSMTTVLTATLTGITGSAGTVTYTSDTSAGTNTFQLTVSGLTASTTYTVQIAGTTIGTVTTDTSGDGTLSLTDITVTVQVGSVVTVLDTTTTPSTTALTGTLGLGMPGGCQGGTGRSQSGSRLTASLTGSTGTSGSAAYWSNTTSGNNGLKVKVSGLTADSTYTVDIGSTSVGEITTDASGDGTLYLSDITATIAAGATVTVLDANDNTVLTGTFAAGSSGADITLHTAHTSIRHG